ncbi:hypothetical protein M8J77_002201 [Diaphorina citri]|nr:hypothetical protein M8J77_002201 [Diaphorina citri]
MPHHFNRNELKTYNHTVGSSTMRESTLNEEGVLEIRDANCSRHGDVSVEEHDNESNIQIRRSSNKNFRPVYEVTVPPGQTSPICVRVSPVVVNSCPVHSTGNTNGYCPMYDRNPPIVVSSSYTRKPKDVDCIPRLPRLEACPRCKDVNVTFREDSPQRDDKFELKNFNKRSEYSVGDAIPCPPPPTPSLEPSEEPPTKDKQEDEETNYCPAYDYLTFNQFREIIQLFKLPFKHFFRFLFLLLFTILYFLVVFCLFLCLIDQLRIGFQSGEVIIASPDETGPMPDRSIWDILQPKATDLWRQC